MRQLMVVTLLFLSGCGFHLRGTAQLPPALSEISVIDAVPATDIAPELRGALKNVGVLISESAPMLLTLRAEKYNKRVLSADSVGRAQEYGLHYSVHFSLQDKKGVMWISDSPITQSRDLRFDAAAVLGTANEESLLKTEMRRDAILQILRQLRYSKSPSEQIELK